MRDYYCVGPASCRVGESLALPAHVRANTRELSRLHVPAGEQGKGYATTLVHAVCRDADAEGILLVLWAAPFGDDIALSRAQLEDWYARAFGFVAIQPDPLLMARAPVVRPRRVNPVMATIPALLRRAA